MARLTAIDPGADGTIVIRAEPDLRAQYFSEILELAGIALSLTIDPTAQR